MKAAIPVNGQSTAVGLSIRKVTVEQVVPERGVAIVSDKMNYTTEIPYRVQHGRGRLPKVGDVWYVDRTIGPWTFLYHVSTNDEDFKTFSEGIVVPVGRQIQLGALVTGSTASLSVRRAATGDAAVAFGVDGDGSSRFVINADGRIGWGPGGSVARDTFLSRSAAGTLKTEGALTVDGNLSVGGVGKKLFARKTANESLTANSVFQDDDHLSVSVAANAVYTMSAVAKYEGATTGDLKTQWVGPAGAALVGAISTLISSAASDLDDYTVLYELGDPKVAGGRGAGVIRAVQWSGVLVTGGTAGTFKLQWAQNTSDPIATIVYANSFVLLERVA